MADQYYPPKTKIYTNAIVTIHRPILTEEERVRRMKTIHDAAVNVLKDLYETERKKQQ